MAAPIANEAQHKDNTNDSATCNANGNGSEEHQQQHNNINSNNNNVDEEKLKLRASCKQLVKESTALLADAMRAREDWDDEWAELLTEEFVAKLIGSFELNSIGARE